MIMAPIGIYPDVKPLAHVIISGTKSNTSSEENQWPSLPNAVTTSSEIYKTPYFLQTLYVFLWYPFGGIITPPDASIGSATKAATLSGPISLMALSSSATFWLHHSSSVMSPFRFGLTLLRNFIPLSIVSKTLLSLSFPEILAESKVDPW